MGDQTQRLPYSAIFFDFDGVLAESAEIKTHAFVTLYAHHGPEILAQVLEHHARHAGISRLTKIRHCHKTLLGVDLDDDALAEMGEAYARAVIDQVVASPWVAGARELVEAHYRHTPLFVVSGTPEEELRLVVERRGMTRYFRSVRGSPTLKDAILKELMAAFGIRRERAVMIGDATTDYNAARAVGIDFIGRVPPGGRNPFPPGTRIISDLRPLLP